MADKIQIYKGFRFLANTFSLSRLEFCNLMSVKTEFDLYKFITVDYLPEDDWEMIDKYTNNKTFLRAKKEVLDRYFFYLDLAYEWNNFDYEDFPRTLLNLPIFTISGDNNVQHDSRSFIDMLYLYPSGVLEKKDYMKFGHRLNILDKVGYK